MNVQRRINLRKWQTEHQFALAQWMEECAGGATNAHQKVGGLPLITLQNTIKTSLFTRNQRKRMVSHNAQVNIGEGLAPQHNLWLAEVKLPSRRLRNHFGQQICKLRKQFGRRFNNADSWFNKHQRRFNQLKQINAKAELRDDKRNVTTKLLQWIWLWRVLLVRKLQVWL